MGGNVVVKALGGKVDVVVCMCGNVAVGGIVGISAILQSKDQSYLLYCEIGGT